MKLLDCFSALGGVSEGFLAEGFEVHGIEINAEIAKLYFDRLNAKYPGKVTVEVADISTLSGKDYQGYDVVWGSPPCRNFSCIGDVFGHTWKNPPNPEGEGMRLVNAYLQFKDDAQPKIWIMENVPRLQKYYRKAKVETSLGDTNMKRCFWGNFPPFLMPKAEHLTVYHHFYESKSGKRKKVEGRIVGIQGKYRQWERAKIPLTCSRAFAVACKEALTPQLLTCDKSRSPQI
jgi:hypothetical protein